MKLKSIFASLAIPVILVAVQSQPSIAAATIADAQNFVETISQNKTKTQAYCDAAHVATQLDEAKAKNDNQKTNELNQKLVPLLTNLGPEYQALLMGYTPEIGRVLADGVKRLCAK